jgi:hypothetical protein
MSAVSFGIKIGATAEQVVNSLLKNFFFGFWRYDETFLVFPDIDFGSFHVDGIYHIGEKINQSPVKGAWLKRNPNLYFPALMCYNLNHDYRADR